VPTNKRLVNDKGSCILRTNALPSSNASKVDMSNREDKAAIRPYSGQDEVYERSVSRRRFGVVISFRGAIYSRPAQDEMI
jgi:hypothetical protein